MNTAIEEIITPEAEKILTPEVVSFVKTEGYQISMELDTLQVTNQEDDKRAVTLGLANKQAINRLEAFRVALVKPLNDHVSNINNIFKKISEPFKQNDALIKSKRDVYIREQERKAREVQARLDEQRRKEQALLDAQRAKEQAKLDKQAAKKGIEATIIPATILPPAPVVETVKTVHTDIGRSTVKKVLKFRIVNEALIPREYLIPDEKKIGALVRSKVLKELPGIEIYEELSQTF